MELSEEAKAKYREYHAKYREAHREELREKRRAYYQKNKEKEKEYQRNKRKQSPELVTETINKHWEKVASLSEHQNPGEGYTETVKHPGYTETIKNGGEETMSREELIKQITETLETMTEDQSREALELLKQQKSGE